jgi:Fe2+ transport system protein B
MIKRANKMPENKKNSKENFSKKVITTLLGIIFFIFIAIIIFSFIFYFAYLFKEKFISALFKIILIGMGIVMYYVLLIEIIKGSSL